MKYMGRGRDQLAACEKRWKWSEWMLKSCNLVRDPNRERRPLLLGIEDPCFQTKTAHP